MGEISVQDRQPNDPLDFDMLVKRGVKKDPSRLPEPMDPVERRAKEKAEQDALRQAQRDPKFSLKNVLGLK